MITKIAIKNNVFTLALLVVMVVSGISVFNSMPRDDMPPFLIRYVSIVTSFPGATPERVENLISDKIEKVVQEIPQVDYITSESRTGISIVTVAIKESEFDLRPIFDNIRRKVEDMEHTLPSDAVVTIKDEVGDVFGIIIGLTADGYSWAEMKEIADDIKDDLIKLPDAAKVEISGVQDERVYVVFDSSRLSDLGLTKQKLQNIISATNIIFPGGDIKLGNERIILEPSGSFQSVHDLKNIIVASSDNQVIRLGDVTRIYKGYVSPRAGINRINGRPGLAIGVNLKKGGNIIRLGKQVDEKINGFLKIYPHGVEIERIASQDVVVETSVQDFIGNLVQAVVVVLLVMLVFLGLKTGMVVASLIPVTMVMTLLIMSILDVGLNTVTLASLIIALGMLVDNAIVISESIIVKMENQATAMDAAIDASKELAIPLLVSSLTTSAAFMAFYLAESVMGEVMGQIFVVVTIALLSSWLLSLTMVALFCVYAIKIKPKDHEKPGIFDRIGIFYRKLLVVNLRKSWVLMVIIPILFAVSILLMKFVPFIFMPKSDRALVTANIELPLGTAIERTESVVNEIEQFIARNLMAEKGVKEGIDTFSTYVGEGAPKYDLGYNPPESSPNAAHILMNTTTERVNDLVMEQLDAFIFNRFPEVTAQVSRLSSAGGSADPVAIRVAGKTPETLFKIAETIKQKLASVTGTKNIADNWGMRTKKLVVNIDSTKAQLAEITHQDIAVSLQTVLSGAKTGDFRQGDKVIPIIMKNENTGIVGVDDLESLNIYAQQTGKNVPLKQVADMDVAWQAAKILRRDLNKTLTVTCDLQPGFTANDVMKKVSPWLENEKNAWGPGYGYTLGGESEDSGKAMSAVADKLPLCVFIIILLLISQFNSIRKPLIILLTIPLGLIGVILGLFITRSYFGFMAFLGMISLAGIVINNGIVLLDRIKIEIEENSRVPKDAIVEAACQRLRPILLTTATTSFGLVPLWIGGGIMWEPMAISIIFGLLFATVLTLLFVPVMYKLLFRVKF